ncbi:LysR family transcriptional regulator [Marinomonas sp. 2405UD68-3]|uniref:LysR family transcriptional regulator n=1 Tax=Marinomonas sp. 2405UD68-3 TaxID=3391835 RepID=UPI0039C918B2
MKISDLQVFIKVAKLQSITAAAKKLDMSSSAASVAIKRIEHSLGKQLFVRTTRHLKLSPEGESYLPLCQQALDLLQQGQAVINEEQLSINGDIRMAMSSEMGRNLMRNLLNDIMSQHKGLSLSLHVSDSRVDFYQDNVDVALRALTKDTIKELNLYGFKICNIPHFLCASPNYLSQYGTPNSLDELLQHNALLYKLYEVTHDHWEFYQNEKKYKVKVASDRTVNDGDIVRRWCIDGVGIAKKSAIDIADDLLTGRLQRLLPDYKIPMTEMWLILPSRQLIRPSIRLIRDALKLKVNALRQELIDKGIVHEDEWR